MHKVFILHETKAAGHSGGVAGRPGKNERSPAELRLIDMSLIFGKDFSE